VPKRGPENGKQGYVVVLNAGKKLSAVLRFRRGDRRKNHEF
jgi:hypothetical protein